VAEHAVEDAAHDVFMVVQRKLGEFDGEQAKLTTWLYEIALRVARRYRAQSAKEGQRRVVLAPVPGDSERTEEAPPAAEVPCSLEQNERLALARRALEALDPDKREAFVLACIEQRSAPEIAQITGVPLNTVYSRIRAARRTFAEAVARLEPAASRRAR
jgi:RNA polymerase sigma-70 factor (ECF subfamily)